MSRTRKAKPAPGKEYWKSRLYPGGENRGPLTKLWTHRKERRAARAEERDAESVYRCAGPSTRSGLCCPDCPGPQTCTGLCHGRHACPEWDGLVIELKGPEGEACRCFDRKEKP